jgi:uncharacterized membrane protein YfcA
MADRGVDIPRAADEPAHGVAPPSVAPDRQPQPEPQPRAWRRVLDPQLIAIGLAGGLLSGLLGVGGGVIMVPLLVLWAGYAQRDAHALSLGAIIPISLAGIATFGIAGEVRVWDALALSIGAVAGARVGAGLLARLDEHVLKLAFGACLVCVAVLMGVRA